MYMPKILKNMYRQRGENIMEAIVYGFIFIMGTLFGSFFTLAVYRIPLGEDIIYKHSFCPNCKAKLKFKDLIPIVSYLALGGKCSYCGEKIRIRYLLLEILSGLVFVLFAFSFKFHLFIINTNMVIYFFLFVLYIATLFIIAGIDKENIKIQRSVLLFGVFVSIAYMTYVCIQDCITVHTYIIYLISIIILLIFDILHLKMSSNESYMIELLVLSLCMIVFSGTFSYYVTLLFTLIWIITEILLGKIRGKEKKNIPIGFYLCTSNIVVVIVLNLLSSWVI